MTNYCHLSYEDRKSIEDGLNNKKSVNQIAKELNRSHSSILREIDRNKIYYKPNNHKYINFTDPKEIYKYEHCVKLDKAPQVCNGCGSRSGCRKERFTYYARKANDLYKELISSCRQGINLTEEEIYNINKIILALVKKGQTTNHLYINHPEVLDFGKSTFYRYINNGVFEFGPLDFPRIVKYKKRKKYKRRSRQEREILIGRTYKNFLEYTGKNSDLNIVEMDTVEGLKTDSKCIFSILEKI